MLVYLGCSSIALMVEIVGGRVEVAKSSLRDHGTGLSAFQQPAAKTDTWLMTDALCSMRIA